MALKDMGILVLLTAIFTIVSSGPVERRQTSQEEFKCPKSFGAFPDGYSCSAYLLCQFDQPTNKLCPHGLNYNPHIGSCDWPQNAPCVERNGVAFRQPFQPADLPEESLIEPEQTFSESSPLYEFDMPEITTKKPKVLYKRKKTTTTQETTTSVDSNGISKDEVKSKSERTTSLEENNNMSSSTIFPPRKYTIIRMSAKPGVFRRRNQIGPLKFKYTSESITTTSTITQKPEDNYDNEEVQDNSLINNELNYITEITKATRRPTTISTNTQPQEITKATKRPTTISTNPQPPVNTYDYEDSDNNNEQDYIEITEMTKPTTIRPTTTSTTKQRTTRRTTTVPTTISKKTTRKTITKSTINPRGEIQGRRIERINQQKTTIPPDYEYEGETTNDSDSSTELPPNYTTLSDAKECDKTKCQLPYCRCGGTDIPGGLKVHDIPQIIMITFDDAVNNQNYNLYEVLFNDSRKNPNGCPVRGTFYIWHEWTDYSLIQTLYAKGNEIASHTISHQHMSNYSKDQWSDEMIGEKEILNKFANVKLEDIKGIRSPFLQIGGDDMFQMMSENGFLYDSSISVSENNPPYFPYTLDYHLSHQCMIPPCPTKSFPGIWEVPAVNFQGSTDGKCSMVDACNYKEDANEINQTFYKNFERHYNSNRAPLPLYFHSVWFDNVKHKDGFLKFIETVNSLPDVYIITTSQMLEWMMNPTTLSEIKNFQPWKCERKDLPEQCTNANKCEIKHNKETRYMGTCNPCPAIYPWILNTNGDKI